MAFSMKIDVRMDANDAITQTRPQIHSHLYDVSYSHMSLFNSLLSFGDRYISFSMSSSPINCPCWYVIQIEDETRKYHVLPRINWFSVSGAFIKAHEKTFS